ncbi:hypothetical protein AALB16_10685 [Lachnospiraceae bacterium 62-35]
MNKKQECFYLFFKNFILFIIGFFSYLAIEISYRGYTFFWSGVMGGIAIVIIDKFNDSISWDMDFALQCILGSMVITSLEFIFGTLDHSIFHLNMWDYSMLPFNYNGIICLPFSIIWIFISGFAIISADWINYYLLKEQEIKPYYLLFGKVIFYYK